jgi:hypothetical protein
MTDPVTIGFGVNKWVKDSDTKMKTLYYMNYGGVSAYTLHDSETGADYQVPTGKKFIILGIVINSDKTSGYDTALWESSSINSSTGTKISEFVAMDMGSGGTINTYIEIATSKYINYYTSTGISIHVIGIETNA